MVTNRSIQKLPMHAAIAATVARSIPREMHHASKSAMYAFFDAMASQRPGGGFFSATLSSLAQAHSVFHGHMIMSVGNAIRSTLDER